jgi:hypothetical protein
MFTGLGSSAGRGLPPYGFALLLALGAGCAASGGTPPGGGTSSGSKSTGGSTSGGTGGASATTSAVTGTGTTGSNTTSVSTTGSNTTTSSPAATTTTGPGSTTTGVSSTTSGGPVSSLNFAIVGDTRPATEDDTAGYPTAIITQIWQDVEKYSPHPNFAITTGDYQFASPTHKPGTQATQIGYYMTARAAFSGTMYPTMGNHECDGSTTDNCDCLGSDCSNAGGSCMNNLCVTPNFAEFSSNMLTPIGQTLPYYTINMSGPGNAWTAKFVFIACNAWSTTQSTWLSGQLAQPTTYTFVVRHMGSDASPAGPCQNGSPNADSIMAQYPYTMFIAGHTHTYEGSGSSKWIVVGNGGAPLSGSVDYGYVIATQQPDMTILFQAFDYQTNAMQDSFSVSP